MIRSQMKVETKLKPKKLVLLLLKSEVLLLLQKEVKIPILKRKRILLSKQILIRNLNQKLVPDDVLPWLLVDFLEVLGPILV